MQDWTGQIALVSVPSEFFEKGSGFGWIRGWIVIFGKVDPELDHLIGHLVITDSPEKNVLILDFVMDFWLEKVNEFISISDSARHIGSSLKIMDS